MSRCVIVELFLIGRLQPGGGYHRAPFFVGTGIAGQRHAVPGGEQPRASQDRAANTEPVSKERAGEIAVEHLGGGRVTWSGKEDDYGALWEIEVTKQDGSEADVYVASDGGVAHVNQKGQGDEAGTGGAQQQQQEPAPEPAQAQTIDAQQAGEIAASHVGGTADSVSREADGDYGATWDVDVYAPDGEYTIYVSATGEIVRVEGPFKD